MRQNPAVQHVGIGQHHVRTLPNCAPRILRRVAVVGERAYLRSHGIHGRLKLVQLILGQRLGREQIQGARARIVHQTLQHRQVVAKRLAARGRRDNNYILSRRTALKRIRLMHVQLRNAPRKQRVPQ